jgi:uncharacterized membrane protein
VDWRLIGLRQEAGMDSDTAWTKGPTLSAWIYDSPNGAAAGKVRLQRLSQRGAIVVVDAVTVTWVRGAHRPRIGRPHGGTMQAAIRRSPLEVLLGRLMFPHGALDGVADLASALHGSGLNEEFLRRLRERFVPDTSALLVLTRWADFDEVQLVIGRGRARGDVELFYAPLTETGLPALEALTHRNAPAEG